MSARTLRVVGRLDSSVQRAIDVSSSHSVYDGAGVVDEDEDLYDDAGALFDRKWVDHELTNKVRVRLRKGTRVKVTNVGTKGNPKWTLEPVQAGDLDATGFLPLIPIAVKAGVSAVMNRASKTAKPKRMRDLDAGESVDLGALFVDTDGRRVQVGEDF